MVLQRKLAFGAVLEDRRVINTNWMKGWGSSHVQLQDAHWLGDFGGQTCLEPADEKVCFWSLCTLHPSYRDPCIWIRLVKRCAFTIITTSSPRNLSQVTTKPFARRDIDNCGRVKFVEDG
jgi:hypothetical protein